VIFLLEKIEKKRKKGKKKKEKKKNSDPSLKNYQLVFKKISIIKMDHFL